MGGSGSAMRDVKGGREPPFGLLALLSALFLRAALSSLLGHDYPPFHSWDLTWALAGDIRCRLARRSGVRRPRFTPALPRAGFPTRAQAEGRRREAAQRKEGVPSTGDTPVPERRRLALLPALCRLLRATLCGFLRHSFLLGTGSSAVYRLSWVTTGGLSGPPSYEM